MINLATITEAIDEGNRDLGEALFA